MKQLNGLDGMFLALDSATTNGVLGGLVIFDPIAEDGERPDEAFMRARIADRLHAVPPLRWVRVRVPLKLDHDYLADADRVDVYAHIRTIRLPSPGTDRELADEVGRLMSVPLTPDRPMWDLWIIEGLDGGRMAHLLRIHHGVLDGGSMPVLWDLLSDKPTRAVDPSWAPTVGARPIGGTVEMAVRGLVGTGLRPARFALLQLQLARWAAGRIREDAATTVPAVTARLSPGILGRPVAKLLNVRQRHAAKPLVEPLVPALRGPRTPFNRKVTARRIFAFTDFSLAELKAAGKPFGVTLNDVVVTMAAGALRRVLLDLDALPDQPLIVCVPIGLRDPEADFRWGNEVTMMFARLPTHLDDPAERLAFVHEALQASKANIDQMPLRHLERAAVFMPEAAFAVPTRVMAAAPEWFFHPATWNTVVSNVRGPSQPATMAGARVQGYWPASFLSPVGGISLTLQSYVDRVDLGAIACKDHIAELDSTIEYLHEELEALKALAALRTAAVEGTSVEGRRAARSTVTSNGSTRRRTTAARPTT